MALLQRVLHRHRTGDNADRWYLQFDTETKRLCVVHEWGNTFRDGTTSEHVELEVAAFLASRNDAGQRELVRLVTAMFEPGPGNAPP